MKKLAFLLDAWVLLPALPFLAVMSQHTVNIPIMDDYDAILGFITSWIKSGWPDRLHLLFSQYNEHRLLYSRIIYVLYYSIFGDINFQNLIFFADLQLLAVAAISAWFIKRCVGGKFWYIVALVWTFCIFDTNTYEAASIAMYGMQNYGILLLFFASLFFFSREGKGNLIAGGLIEFIMIFSSGNGMIAAFFVVLLNLRQKDKLKKIVSIAVAAVCIPLYFVSYTKVVQPGQLPFNPGTVITYFIQETGAPVSFENSLISGLVILAILVGSFIAVFRSNAKLWPILCILGFVLASMGTAALFRACMVGAQFQTSRYLIYPQLVIAVTFSLGWVWLETKNFRWPVVGIGLLAIVGIFGSNFNNGKAGFMRMEARAESLPYYHTNVPLAKSYSDAACEAGVYCIEMNK